MFLYVGLELRYLSMVIGLWAEELGIDLQLEQSFFFFLAQIGYVAYPTSYPVGARDFFPGSKVVRMWS